MSYEAFGGRVVFHMRAQSLGGDMTANSLSKKIIAAVDFEESETITKADFEAMVAAFCFQIANTDGIDFHLDSSTRQGLRDFETFWKAHKKLAPADLWKQRLALPHVVFNEWNTAFAEGQALFDVPPDHLPTEALTQEQLKELEDPESPLALAAEPLGAK